MSREAMQKALEALEEIGLPNTIEIAMAYHEAMAGHRPERHARLDADIETVRNAANALRAELAGGENEQDK